ncbi:MAG: LysR family transcriptional regulator [Proteobacteria bacterium]|nr:LysR family transcriptional regulator [Pseudomonadota bacterium]
MDPRFLRQLAEILDTGSVTRAAEVLGVPQSTLSRNMKSLEASVGAPVFERGRYGIIPTRIGTVLAREGRQIRLALKQAETEHQHWRSGLHGTLRVGVGTMLAHSLMAAFLDHPLIAKWHVALHLSVEGTERLLEQVRRDELDLAIVQGDLLEAPNGLKQNVVLEETIGFYVAPAHPLARRRTLTLADLAAVEFLAVGTFFDHVVNAFHAAKCAVKSPRLRFSGDVAMALHLLARGRHVAVLPDIMMANLCDGRTYARLRVEAALPRRVIAAWHRADMEGHPLLADFMRRLRAFLGDLRKRSR